jgi:hypothetical protein
MELEIILWCPTHQKHLVGNPTLTEKEPYDENDNRWLVDLSDVMCPAEGETNVYTDCQAEWEIKVTHLSAPAKENLPN